MFVGFLSDNNILLNEDRTHAKLTDFGSAHDIQVSKRVHTGSYFRTYLQIEKKIEEWYLEVWITEFSQNCDGKKKKS